MKRGGSTEDVCVAGGKVFKLDSGRAIDSEPFDEMETLYLTESNSMESDFALDDFMREQSVREQLIKEANEEPYVFNAHGGEWCLRIAVHREDIFNTQLTLHQEDRADAHKRSLFDRHKSAIMRVVVKNRYPNGFNCVYVTARR